LTGTSDDNHLEEMNKWADHWRYNVGVNTIPMTTRNKTGCKGVSWIEFQKDPVSDFQHEQWKAERLYGNGIGAMLGKVWHNPFKKELFLIGIDADNQKAIDEICTYKGKKLSILELAQWTLVEQHPDCLSKAHIYIYSHNPLPKKSSDNNNPTLENYSPVYYNTTCKMY
jgi:hypothetical protein